MAILDQRYLFGDQEQFTEFFAEFDKITDSKTKVPRDEMSIPVTFYIKDSEYIVSRSVHPTVNLKHVVQKIFPHLFEADGETFLSSYKNFQLRIAGFTPTFDTNVLYLYETFKATDGVLYFTVVY